MRTSSRRSRRRDRGDPGASVAQGNFRMARDRFLIQIAHFRPVRTPKREYARA
jgi:hypothetical protein